MGEMNRNINVNIDKLIDLIECMQDATQDEKVIGTLDEVIDVVYELAKEDKQIEKELGFNPYQE